MAEWIACLPTVREISRLNPSILPLLHACSEYDQLPMLVVKRLAGVAPEVNLRNPLHIGEEAHKPGIHPGFETQDRCHQKSKTGVSVASQKRLVSSKKKFSTTIKLLTKQSESTDRSSSGCSGKSWIHHRVRTYQRVLLVMVTNGFRFKL